MWPQASNSSTTENDSLAEMQRLEIVLKNNLEEYMTRYYVSELNHYVLVIKKNVYRVTFM